MRPPFRGHVKKLGRYFLFTSSAEAPKNGAHYVIPCNETPHFCLQNYTKTTICVQFEENILTSGVFLWWFCTLY